MIARLFAIKQAKVKAAALAEFKDPLPYLDEKAIRKLRFRVISWAVFCMLIGAALVALVMWAGPDVPRGHYGGRGLMLFFVGGIYLICYGIYKLCTLKRGMAKLRQAELVHKYWHIV